MKKLIIPLLILAAIVLTYEQSQDTPNIYLRVGCICVFMFALYKLNARIPHKSSHDKDTEDVQ